MVISAKISAHHLGWGVVTLVLCKQLPHEENFTLKYPSTAPQSFEIWLYGPLLTQAVGNMYFKSWEGKSVFPSCFPIAHFPTLRNAVSDAKNRRKNGNCRWGTQREGKKPNKNKSKTGVITANLNQKDVVEDEKRNKTNLQTRSCNFSAKCLISELNQRWLLKTLHGPSPEWAPEISGTLIPQKTWFITSLCNCPLGARPILNPCLTSWFGGGILLTLPGKSWMWKSFKVFNF